jgi:hypothetical protein
MATTSRKLTDTFCRQPFFYSITPRNRGECPETVGVCKVLSSNAVVPVDCSFPLAHTEEDDDEIETDANARQGGDSAAVFSRPVGRSESRPQSGPTKRTREESRTRARTASPVKRHVNSKTAPEKKQISPARKRVPEKKPLTLSTAAAAIRQQRAAVRCDAQLCWCATCVVKVLLAMQVATLSGADPVAGARDPKASQRSRPSAAGAGAPKVCVPPPKRKESWTNFGDFIPNSYGYRVTLKPDIDLSSIASRTAGATSIQSSNSRDVRPQPPVKAVEISSPREPGKAKSPFLKPRPRVAASTRPSPGTGGPRPSSGPKPALSSHGNAQDVESVSSPPRMLLHVCAALDVCRCVLHVCAAIRAGDQELRGPARRTGCRISESGYCFAEKTCCVAKGTCWLDSGSGRSRQPHPTAGSAKSGSQSRPRARSKRREIAAPACSCAARSGGVVGRGTGL